MAYLSIIYFVTKVLEIYYLSLPVDVTAPAAADENTSGTQHTQALLPKPLPLLKSPPLSLSPVDSSPTTLPIVLPIVLTVADDEPDFGLSIS